MRWLLTIDEERYGRRDDPRLTQKAQDRWPKQIVVYGTRNQAEMVATLLSFEEPGCTDFWVVDDEPTEEV